jgi:hypothetical protein
MSPTCRAEGPPLPNYLKFQSPLNLVFFSHMCLNHRKRVNCYVFLLIRVTVSDFGMVWEVVCVWLWVGKNINF